MALKIHKVKPMFTSLVTTMNKYEEDVKSNGLVDTSKLRGTLKEYQTVVEVGPNVRGIKAGDMVMINPKRYAVMKHKEGSLKDGVIQDNKVLTYNFDIVEMEGQNYLLLQDTDIMYVFEGEEVADEESKLIVPDTSLIV